MVQRRINRIQKEKKYFMGIDPGADGACFTVNKDLQIVDWFDHPGEMISLYHRLGETINKLNANNEQIIIALEKVWGIPKMKGMFNFGANWAGWKMAVISYGITLLEPRPNEWQKGLFVKTDMIRGKKKTRSITVARRLYPRNYDLFKNLGSDGRADACLIARWAKEQM